MLVVTYVFFDLLRTLLIKYLVKNLKINLQYTTYSIRSKIILQSFKYTTVVFGMYVLLCCIYVDFMHYMNVFMEIMFNIVLLYI